MSESTTLVMIATVYAPTLFIWIAAISAALIVPHYALRSHIPWPVCALLILALMVMATAATMMMVRG
jgi:hypothetical protein